MEIFNLIPDKLQEFGLVFVFSLIIGLSQRRIHPPNIENKLFGTDRTFTFIGILGFILYVIGDGNMLYFLGGGLVLSVFLALFYYLRAKTHEVYGITTIVIALITYCLTPLAITQPRWLFLLIVVTVLILTELKESFTLFSQKLNKDEFITFAKFLVIAGVILPMVPDTPIVSFLSLTPYKIWLAVVVISTISYISYLLHKSIFKESGIILTGILGGLYSSTATTIIIAKKCRESQKNFSQYATAIILATAMMYLRILIIIFIFNSELFAILFPWMLTLFIASGLLGFGILLFNKDSKNKETTVVDDEKNPLEFKVAMLFTLLYIAFSFLTWYVLNYFGNLGLNVLSYIVGVSDIDPFLINLFQGKFAVSNQLIALATLQAIISNNVVKLIYAMLIAKKKLWKLLLISFATIILLNLLILLFI
ncbi:MAG: DUF4010 domain-containing protein [Bacteroidota bacterium]